MMLSNAAMLLLLLVLGSVRFHNISGPPFSNFIRSSFLSFCCFRIVCVASFFRVSVLLPAASAAFDLRRAAVEFKWKPTEVDYELRPWESLSYTCIHTHT